MSMYAKLLVSLLPVLLCHPGKSQTKTATRNTLMRGPESIVRNIIQDKSGAIWMASFQGVYRYGSPAKNGDALVFTNVTSDISQARFFSILQDSRGMYWFGSIGDGVYRYDGKSFQHFTLEDGLLNNDIGCIYEDSKGNIWFGVYGGASCYDGKHFRNYILEGETMKADTTGIRFKTRRPYEVTAILEDKAGKFWLATRGNTFIYNSRLPGEREKTFSVVTHEGKPFRNVRCVLQDRKGNIWLGGNDGLWRYDGTRFTHLSPKFTGYIMEDKDANIWTSAEKPDNGITAHSPQFPASNSPSGPKAWSLSRYDANSLHSQKPSVTEIAFQNMFFGILEAADRSIWVGSLDGVYRYDGKTISHLQ